MEVDMPVITDVSKGRWMWVDVGIDFGGVDGALANPNRNCFSLAWVPDDEDAAIALAKQEVPDVADN